MAAGFLPLGNGFSHRVFLAQTVFDPAYRPSSLLPCTTHTLSLLHLLFCLPLSSLQLLSSPILLLSLWLKVHPAVPGSGRRSNPLSSRARVAARRPPRRGSPHTTRSALPRKFTVRTSAHVAYPSRSPIRAFGSPPMCARPSSRRPRPPGEAGARPQEGKHG